MPEERKEKQPCPCTFDCSRHGYCEECIAFHCKIGTPVSCMEGLVSEKAKEPGRILTLADKPYLTDFAACAG